MIILQDTTGISMIKTKNKELVKEYLLKVDMKNMQNGKKINAMAAVSWSIEMEALIGVNSRIIKWKDSEHGNIVMETNTQGNS